MSFYLINRILEKLHLDEFSLEKYAKNQCFFKGAKVRSGKYCISDYCQI